MGYSHRNCVFIGCPSSRQRLGKWAATTCELHGCNNGSSMCDCQPLFKLFLFLTERKNPECRLQWTKNISRNSLNRTLGCLTRIQEFGIYTSLTFNQRLKTQTQLCNLVTTRKLKCVCVCVCVCVGGGGGGDKHLLKHTLFIWKFIRGWGIA